MLAIFIICNLMIVPAITFSYAVIIPIVLLWINDEKVWVNAINPHFSKHLDQ
jgi:hypothetical protein